MKKALVIFSKLKSAGETDSYTNGSEAKQPAAGSQGRDEPGGSVGGE